MINVSKHFFLVGVAVAATYTAGAPAAFAAVTSIEQSAFSLNSPIVDFANLPFATDINGLSFGGITFSYLVGGSPSDGQVTINTGPGATNNLSSPSAVSTGTATGTVVMILPRAVTQFGYGYAVLGQGIITDATTMSIFNGNTALGSLSFTAANDPVFSGGFAGLQSTTGFNRVELTFTGGPAFAFGKLRYTEVAAAVPEPQTWAIMLLGFGFVGVTLRSRRRRPALAA